MLFRSVKGISDRMVETLDKANQTFADAEVQKVSKSLQETLARGREILDQEAWLEITANLRGASQELNRLAKAAGEILRRMDTSIAHHDQAITETIAEFNTAARNASAMMDSGNALIGDTQTRMSRADRKLAETLESLRVTAANLNRLIDQIKDQPSALLFSAPPPEKPVEPAQAPENLSF